MGEAGSSDMAEPTIPPCRSLDDFLAWKEQQEERYELLPGGW